MRTVSASSIRRDIRLRGRLIRLACPCFTERKFRAANWILDRAMKGRWRSPRLRVEERFVPRGDGGELRLLVCTPRARRSAGVTGLLWMHGGGYALGVPEQDAAYVELLCGDGGCVAVLPDYRRATEDPYPAALEDCHLALRWTRDHAAELGVREDQIFVGGDSAGGGLAIATCLCARDRGEVRVAFQMPLYPMLDDRPTATSRDNDAPVWNTRSNEAGWRLYLGSLYGTGDVPAYAAPARAASYEGMPPAATLVGTVEPFYAETCAYVEGLRAEGIPVHFKAYEGCFHAFDYVCGRSEVGRDARRFMRDAFSYAQGHYFAEQ